MGDNGRKNNTDVWLAGVDGCRGGWVVAFVRPAGEELHFRVVPDFPDILAGLENPSIVAVDMPIGLPERAGRGGREAEARVRPLLGMRQSSVFSIPSRAAVYSQIGPFENQAATYAAHRQCSVVARSTSDPPRGVAIQSFMIFPKIRELDARLCADPVLAERIFETHPEVAFWRLNGEQVVETPKKVGGRPHPPGMALRRDLLIAAGMPREVLTAKPPKGAAEDDLLDAFACAAIARRLHAGIAEPFPNPPPVDRYGLPMAIWA
jgi:predicted RNase H-like nuclease